ncbi:raffinose synthase Sip1 [Terfezia boudieri ATCC MYA-4762]|uniref:Raffinose synthase Sip1 n=1 Tax=Terfezia boudieri ATCC MYA-4762 TaxID=1051890 RepID=A0A3N4LJK6_9PEZI|nr:raffinose synthase Sip1 [Terfezia boudieri ATCC MYA-4762]
MRFTAVLELSSFSQNINMEEQDEDLSVELWYGAEGVKEWQEAKFKLADASSLTVLQPNPTRRQKHFHLNLEYSDFQPLNFTIRFRTSPIGPWLWAGHYGSNSDGRLIFRSSHPYALQPRQDSLRTFFQNPSNSITASSSFSQVSGVRIWDLNAPIGPSTSESVSLGTPIDMERYYALVKLSSPWMGPRQGGNTMSLDKNGLVVGFMRSDGMNVVVMGMAAVDECTTYIKTGAGGTVILRTRNDGVKSGVHRAILAVGSGWQETLDAAFYRARELVSGSSNMASADNDLQAQWRREWYDGLAYCTWNGLGREITEDKILGVLQDLADNGIKVSALIIDDNWQSLISRKWDKFEADSTQFPRGLKATVSTIKIRFPHITHVAVWHATFGYWDGIAPGGWVDKNYKTKTLKWHGGNNIMIVAEDDIGRLFDDFYKFLADCGVDGVKADVQASLDELDRGVDRYRITIAYQDAFKLASMNHFGRKVIYCMAMQPYILLNYLLSPSGSPPVLRNSDDFFPNIASSHPWHIFANSMNSLYTSHLGALPDWDMFQSSLPTYGSMHAAARCISGGPIYITDSPGRHDLNLIKQMSASTPDGASGLISLRPSRVAIPMNPYIKYQGPQLLRVGNFVGGKGGDALLAIFNTATSSISELVHLADFPGIEPGEMYIVRAFSANTVVYMGSLGGSNPKSISLTLDPNGWEFFTATRVSKAKGSYVGTVGLVDKIAGAAAIVSKNIIAGNNLGRGGVEVRVKALGVLGYYVDNLPRRNIKDMLITVEGKVVPVDTVRKGEGRMDKMLLFDLEKAWGSMHLAAPWSGDVDVVLSLP